MTSLGMVVDVDSHVTEPRDLWTSRVPRRWRDEVPQVVAHPRTDRLVWRIGDYLGPDVGAFSTAGFDAFWPSTPSTYEHMLEATYDPVARLRQLDADQIWAQVLYPNIVGFETDAIIRLGADVAVACIRAYNDFIVEWAATDRRRLVPVMMLPLWDLGASLAELQRCLEAGVHAMLFAGHLELIGLPSIWERHWDPLFAAAQEADVSVNLHIGFSGITVEQRESMNEELNDISAFDVCAFVKRMSVAFMNSGDTIADLILSGSCDRFPDLTFVSVESGFGYVPYLLDGLDWQWENADGRRREPHRLLPSEYFRRQIMATFWFERGSLDLLPAFQDNVMFETDFPHQTCVAAGPASFSPSPAELIERNLAAIPAGVREKALWTNAARVYRIPAPDGIDGPASAAADRP